MFRLKSLRVLAAAIGLGAVASVAWAATVDYKEVSVSLSKKGGRPQAPVISVSDATGTWAATGAPATLKLRVHARVNSSADVRLVRLGVPGLLNPKGTWTAYSMQPPFHGEDAVVDPTTHQVPSNALAIPSLIAGQRCAAAFANPNPPQGPVTLPFSLDVEVEVQASNNNTHVSRNFTRTIPAEIRCSPTSRTVAEPHRVPGAPQRTPGAPKRTALPYRPLTADLGFARATNATACPIDIRQSIRIVSQGPGTAKVYIVRQDNPGVLGAPIYVNVTTRLPDAKYVGVLQRTVRFTKTFKGTYRVLAVNPFGEPVPSPWAVLDVRC